MRNRSRVTWCLPLLLLFALPLSPGAVRAQSGAHTEIALIADVQEIRPGLPFTVGIVLRMEPGWHTYWRNAGESGLPTEVRWGLPAGFSAGELQWPIPEKKVEEGDILTFGYSDETMLMAVVTPPSTLVPGATCTLRVEANWLECERTCIPGEGSAQLVLPVRDAEPRPDNAEVFAAYRKALPRPLLATDPVTVVATIEEAGVILNVAPSGGGEFSINSTLLPDFFPYASEVFTTGRVSAVLEQGQAVITVPVMHDPKKPAPDTLRGIIVIKDEQSVPQAFEVAFPLSGVTGSEGLQQGSILDQTFAFGQPAADQTPFILYVLFAVVGGLLLNIMPCVLPVIALKVFGLVKMAGDEPTRVRRLGLMFSLGILVSFLVLAFLVIILKLAGQQVGWGFQFQEPIFVVLMCAVVFAFGLSLFGVFEIRLPGSAVAGVGSVLARQEGHGKGYLASFSEGVFATILATPCTAPFLGSALGFAFSQPAGSILVIFSCVALGMALPYLLLTARPAWRKYLPKPGEWMVTVKQFMGFLMMATLLWLLYVLGKQLGMEAVIWTGAFLLVVGVAVWLVGRFATLSAARRKVFAIWFVASCLIVFGYWFFIESTLDIRSAIAGTSGDTDSVESTGGIPWQPFSVTALEGHLKAGQPVFLDFTAEWCLTCKVNERTVLANEQVVERLRVSGIVPMKADWTNRNPDITRLLAKFGRSGVPLYVFFPAGRPTQPVILPEVITPGIVLEALDQAATPGSATR